MHTTHSKHLVGERFYFSRAKLWLRVSEPMHLNKKGNAPAQNEFFMCMNSLMRYIHRWHCQRRTDAVESIDESSGSIHRSAKKQLAGAYCTSADKFLDRRLSIRVQIWRRRRRRRCMHLRRTLERIQPGREKIKKRKRVANWLNEWKKKECKFNKNVYIRLQRTNIHMEKEN